MKIAHVAFWVKDLEQMRSFYERYFNAVAGLKYVNPVKKVESYFLTFDGDTNDTRMELMQMPGITAANDRAQLFGLAHLAISVGSSARVDELTERLRSEGVIIAGEPRTTGDGYYESVGLDPEGNRIEITI